MNNPLLTVVVTTYKRDKFLKEALLGILDQNYKNIEIIVIDDNPDKNDSSTKKVVTEIANERKFTQVRYIKNEKNIGMSNGHKIGFSNARGKYIVFHDDDDYYTDPDWFESAVSIMMADSDISFVGGRSYAFSEENIEEDKLELFGKIKSKKYLQEFTVIGKPLSTFAAIFDIEKLKEAKFEDMLIANDTTIYLRSLLRGDGFLTDKFIGMYRVHSNSLTKSINANVLLLHIDEKENLLKDLNWTTLEKDDFYLKQAEMNLGYYILRNANPDYGVVFEWISGKQKKYRRKLKLITLKFIVKKQTYELFKNLHKK